MNLSRRHFNKLLPLGALVPQQLLSSLEGGNANAMESALLSEKIDEVYDKAIVFDGIVITRNWDVVADEALAQSGYTGFNASLDSGNLKRALASLAEWHMRIKRNPNRFITATHADDFIRAKKEGKVAVMMGFQNTTLLENSIDNMDILY
jgi:membrane dipeptidase